MHTKKCTIDGCIFVRTVQRSHGQLPVSLDAQSRKGMVIYIYRYLLINDYLKCNVCNTI